ncbi:hypothetical protein CAL7716_043930 [Calothrix sp. PCC 7716]|nr:hypothetical protein CAL7716_043930 [Calothrix sp. PCC 7716]
MSKLPNIDETTRRVKTSIEKSLHVSDVINGKKTLGGSLGKRYAKAAQDANTREFDQFCKDVDFLIKNYTKDGKSLGITIDRLRTSVASLRNQQGQGGKK